MFLHRKLTMKCQKLRIVDQKGKFAMFWGEKNCFPTDFLRFRVARWGLAYALSWIVWLEQILQETIRRSLKNAWTPPPLPERKRKIYSSIWDSIISRYSLWSIHSSIHRWFIEISFHKTSQKLHWNDADQNDWFSDFSGLFPYSASFKMKLW